MDCTHNTPTCLSTDRRGAHTSAESYGRPGGTATGIVAFPTVCRPRLATSRRPTVLNAASVGIVHDGHVGFTKDFLLAQKENLDISILTDGSCC